MQSGTPNSPLSPLKHLVLDAKTIYEEAAKDPKSILIDRTTAIQRLKCCLKCKYISKLITCCEPTAGCRCFMPPKVIFKHMKCPINKW